MHSLHKKIKFSFTDFSSKCDQIHRKLRIWSNLLQKSLMENSICCAVWLPHWEKVISSTVADMRKTAEKIFFSLRQAPAVFNSHNCSSNNDYLYDYEKENCPFVFVNMSISFTTCYIKVCKH